MIFYRALAWDDAAGETQRDGPLWFPREYQGDGRHDNPDRYGCLYLAADAVSPVVEQLARFRGQPLSRSMLVRRGNPLALARIELAPEAELLDLDDPVVLERETLRPSLVATHQRAITQDQARKLHRQHDGAAGMRWWSIYESLWMNVTVFDRGAPHLQLLEVRELTLDDPVIVAAAAFLGLMA